MFLQENNTEYYRSFRFLSKFCFGWSENQNLDHVIFVFPSTCICHPLFLVPVESFQVTWFLLFDTVLQITLVHMVLSRAVLPLRSIFWICTIFLVFYKTTRKIISAVFCFIVSYNSCVINYLFIGIFEVVTFAKLQLDKNLMQDISFLNEIILPRQKKDFILPTWFYVASNFV